MSALELQPAPEAQPRSGTAKDTANGTALRRPRDDALPEHTRYRDRGCDLFASCLACPLPHCRYDVPGGARAMLNRVRDQEIRRLRTDAGLPVDEIAARFGLSRRTVFRVLQRARGGGVPISGHNSNGRPNGRAKSGA